MQPLGMQSKVIKDDQLDAKSYNNGWEPKEGRLHNNRAWCSHIEDPGVEYFEIDLKRVRHVSAIATQGIKGFFREYYVKTYTLEYSYDGTRWYQYKQSVAGTYKEKVCLLSMLYIMNYLLDHNWTGYYYHNKQVFTYVDIG